MVVLVTGDRGYPEEKKHVVLDAIAKLMADDDDLEIVEGGASGADSYAREACRLLKITYHEYPAQWRKYGKSAGPIRNRYMLERHPDIALVLAFHDDLEHSKGTKDMVEVALENGIQVILHENGREIELEQLTLFD